MVPLFFVFLSRLFPAGINKKLVFARHQRFYFQVSAGGLEREYISLAIFANSRAKRGMPPPFR